MFGSQQPIQKLPSISQDQRYGQQQYAIGSGMNNSGVSSGMIRGRSTGISDGMNSGVNSGINSGVNSGVNSGMNSGMNSGISSTSRIDTRQQLPGMTSQLPPLSSVYTADPVQQPARYSPFAPLSPGDDVERGVRKVRRRKRSVISTGSGARSRSRSRSQSQSRRGSRYGELLEGGSGIGNNLANRITGISGGNNGDSGGNKGISDGNNGDGGGKNGDIIDNNQEADNKPSIAKPPVCKRRGPWSPEEDKKLLSLVDAFGGEKNLNWVKISQMLGTRTAKQARERYHQNLKPSLNKSPITPEEGRVIEGLVAKYGKRWAEIARHLNGRSDNAIKNWWNGGANRRRRAREAQARKEATGPLARQPPRVPFVVQPSTPQFNTSIFCSSANNNSNSSGSSGSVSAGVGSDPVILDQGQPIHLPPLRYGRSASVDMRSNLGIPQEPLASSLRKQTLLGAGPADSLLRRHSVATVNPMGNIGGVGNMGNSMGNLGNMGNPMVSPLSNLSSRNSSITEYSAFGLPGGDAGVNPSRRASAFAIPPSSAPYVSPSFAPRLSSSSSSSQIPPMTLEDPAGHQGQSQQQGLPGLRRDIFKKNFTLQPSSAGTARPSRGVPEPGSSSNFGPSNFAPSNSASSNIAPSNSTPSNSAPSNSVPTPATTSGSPDIDARKDKMSISFLT